VKKLLLLIFVVVTIPAFAQESTIQEPTIQDQFNDLEKKFGELENKFDTVNINLGTSIAIQVVLAGATIILVGFTIWNIRQNRQFTERQLRLDDKQMKMLEKEHRHEYKAVLEVNVKGTRNLKTKSGQEEYIKLLMNFQLVNTGTITASNVYIYFHIFDKRLSINEIVKKETEIKSQQLQKEFSLLPENTMELGIVKKFE